MTNLYIFLILSWFEHRPNTWQIYKTYLICKQNWTLSWSLEHLQFVIVQRSWENGIKTAAFCAYVHVCTHTHVGGCACVLPRVGEQEGGREGEKKGELFSLLIYSHNSGPGNRWFPDMGLMLQTSSCADTSQIRFVAKASHLENFDILPVCLLSMWYVSENDWRRCSKAQHETRFKAQYLKKKVME